MTEDNLETIVITLKVSKNLLRVYDAKTKVLLLLEAEKALDRLMNGSSYAEAKFGDKVKHPFGCWVGPA